MQSTELSSHSRQRISSKNGRTTNVSNRNRDIAEVMKSSGSQTRLFESQIESGEVT